MSNKSDYETPKLVVDIIIELVDSAHKSDDPNDPSIVMIQRANTPEGLALPGGFVDVGETPWQAAIREAKEETGLAVGLKEMFHVYGNPKRDARLHAVSIVFIAEGYSAPKAGDDAKDATAMFLTHARQAAPVFDHGLILADYATYLRTGVRPDWYR